MPDLDKLDGPLVLSLDPDGSVRLIFRLLGHIPLGRDSNLEPVEIQRPGRPRKHYWLYKGYGWATMERLSSWDVKALVLERENKLKAIMEWAMHPEKRVEQMSRYGGRAPISDEVKMFVWQRDNGACIHCGARALLEFDHIIPLSMGGSNTARNLQLLCENCNRTKGGKL